MDSAGNLVDILTARTLSANGDEFNFIFWNDRRTYDISPMRA
jgi:hypothetical protein